MAKVKGEMNLLLQKIQMKENTDWGSPELSDIEPGLYLCENPDGGMFIFYKVMDGCVFGIFLSIQDIGKIHAREAEQKVCSRHEL